VFRSWQPDLILMDIQLPGIDGLELTRRLKRDPRDSRIVISALTAYAMKATRTRQRASQPGHAGPDDARAARCYQRAGL
jgi:two-component system cell cycle response regulator DivK